MSQITPVAAERAYKFASWNVNGLRAVLKKDPSFTQIAEELDADILAIQETKMQEGQAHIDLPGYLQVWSYAERKGYSGTAVFVREEALGAPLSVRHAEELLPLAAEGAASELVATAVTEGRVCALEFERFWFVDVYTPNAQNELARIDTRMAWDDAYRAFLQGLERETGKPVVTCGDFNVAHEEIDLKNPKSNRGNAGFSDEERGKFTELLDAGFTDTFRLRGGRLQLVELSVQRAQEQRGMAYRLLPGERCHRRPRSRRNHPQRHLRQRPLPCRARHRAVSPGRGPEPAAEPGACPQSGHLSPTPATRTFSEFAGTKSRNSASYAPSFLRFPAR